MPIRNDAGETIPGFGIVRPTGIVTGPDGQPALSVAKPDRNEGFGLLVAGWQPIPAGAYGVASRARTVWVLYETGEGTPAVGALMGSLEQSYRLSKELRGWAVLAVDAAAGRVYAARYDRTGKYH